MEIKKINEELTKLIEAWGNQSTIEDTYSNKQSLEERKEAFCKLCFGDIVYEEKGKPTLATLIQILNDFQYLYFGGRLKKANIIKQLKTDIPMFNEFFGDLPYKYYEDYWCSEIWTDGFEGEKFVKRIKDSDDDTYNPKYLVTDLKGLVDMYKEALEVASDVRGECYYLSDEYYFKEGKLQCKSASIRTFVSQLDKIIDEEIRPISEYNIAILEKYLPAFD